MDELEIVGQTELELVSSHESAAPESMSNEGLSASALLKQAKLSQFEAVSEMWEISGSSQRLAYFTHGLLRYYGKFPPPVATRLIERYSVPGDTILDPMVGSGTTLVEALLLGRSGIGIDLNPLACLASRVKVGPVNPQKVEGTLSVLHDRFDAILRSGKSLTPLVPVIPRIDHWFFPETTVELAALRRFISEEIADEKVRSVFWVAFAAIIRKVSRASVGMGRIFFDPYHAHQPVLPVFAGKLTSMMPALRELWAHKRTGGQTFEVIQGNANKSPLASESQGLIICHPPYFNVYKYSSVYRFEMLWLGFDVVAVQAGEVREAFKVGKPEKVMEYVADMHDVLREQYRLLRPRGVCGLMIGDTVMKGERVCTTSMVLDRAREVGFAIDRLFVRKPMLTEASYKTALRRKAKDLGANLSDFVIVLRRPA